MSGARRAVCRAGLLAAALLAAGMQASAAALAAAPCAPAAPAAEARSPVAHVRGFYDWYLGALRAGRRPFDDDAALQAWLTPNHVAELRSGVLLRHDRVLALAWPLSNWLNMRVKIAKPKYYRDPGACVAYLDVTYSGFADPLIIDPRLKYIDIPPLWRIGLVRTASGWRITSIDQDIGDD